MKPLAAIAALVLTVAAAMSPALARDTYVIDNAHLLSANAIAQINAKVADFNAQTHKEIVVNTEPTGTGASIGAMAEKTFAQHQINGMLILITKQPKGINVSVDHASARFFPAGSTAAIRQAMVSAFNSGDFDGGVNNGVDLALSQFRSHLGSLRTTTTHAVPVQNVSPVRNETGGGFNMSIIFWIIALVVIFAVVRGIFRAMSGPRMMPPGYGGGPGYGPGYGGGGFGGGGGGGFFSGLLGGLGGAFLGNELFGNRGNFGGNTYDGNQAGFVDGNQSQDAGGWQNDAGQIDTGSSSSGSWGDSGGGGGWGGGGDSGGGGGWGGGDSGGGGGDSGGGW